MTVSLEWITPVKAVMTLAKRAYSGNFLAIAVREGVGQNSPDAGATRCDVLIERLQGAGDDGADVTRVLQIDDGRGMTPEVLQSAFFTFGGTFKPEGGAGGFGYAKFAVLDGDATVNGNEWDLWTRPRGADVVYHVTSSMLGLRPIEALPATSAPAFFPHAHGTAIVVYRRDAPDPEEALRVLENTHRPGVRFYVNGVEVEQLTRATEKARLSFGRVLFKKSCRNHQRGYLVVRARGSFQFKVRVGSRMDGVAILEIDEHLRPTDESYALTPSREQVRDRYRPELDQVLEGFKKAEQIKENDPFVVTRYRGRRGRRPLPPMDATPAGEASDVQLRALSRAELNAERELADRADEPEIPYEPPPMTWLRRDDRELEAQREWAAARAAASAMADRLEGGISRAHLDGGAVPEEIDVPDIIVRRHRDVRKSINPFSRRNVRFMAAWHAVISEILTILGLPDGGFGIGWCLTTESLAERYVEDKQEFLLLSPRGVSRKDITALTLLMIQRAAHEIAHRRLGWHDEEFTSTLHGYLEQVNPHLRRLQRLVRGAMGNRPRVVLAACA